MKPWPHRCSAWRVTTALNAGVKFKLADGSAWVRIKRVLGFDESAWVWIKRVLGFNFFLVLLFVYIVM